MMKNSGVITDFAKSLKKLQTFFANRHPKKYFTMFFANYLTIFLKEVEQNFEKLPENTKNCLKLIFIDLFRMKATLELTNFFETYGNYLKNYDLIRDFFEESREIFTIFPTKDAIIPQFSKKLAEILDSSNRFSAEEDSNELFAVFFKETPPTFSEFFEQLPLIFETMGQNSCFFEEKAIKNELFGSCADVSPKKKLLHNVVSQFLERFLTNSSNFSHFLKGSVQNLAAPKKFKFAELTVIRSLKVFETLVLKIVEIPANAPMEDPFVLNSLIKIFPDSTISVGDCARKPLLSAHKAIFGRFSSDNSELDVSFGDNRREISRKQFSILKSEVDSSFLYKLQCIAQTPKQETCWKLHDEPLSLKHANLVTLSAKEVLLVRVFEVEGEEIKTQETEEAEDEEDTKPVNLMRKARSCKACCVTFEGICKENSSMSYGKAVRVSFVKEDVYEICEGVHDNNGIFLDQSEIREIYEPFHIGKHWIFEENSVNDTGLRVFYKKNVGWLAQGLAKSQARYKQVQTLISVNTFDRYVEKKFSRLEVLQENQIIYIAGYAFLVCQK